MEGLYLVKAMIEDLRGDLDLTLHLLGNTINRLGMQMEQGSYAGGWRKRTEAELKGYARAALYNIWQGKE